jgi:hypothetical protein
MIPLKYIIAKELAFALPGPPLPLLEGRGVDFCHLLTHSSVSPVRQKETGLVRIDSVH